ncbi:MAG: NADPH-dependent F420 reductase [Paenibacillaceae bacterium]|nr:NADPH-dependent F420 reductase [Paenibacillaceae bacterium]
MKIACIGLGHVGEALATQLIKCGHEIIAAVHDPHSETLKRAMERMPACRAAPIKEAVAEADVVFLAVPFGAVQSVIDAIADGEGKIVVDCTNPVGAGLKHGLDSTIGGSALIQQKLPQFRIVKAFTIYGYENFIDNTYTGYGALAPAMLIAGNDDDAKKVVSTMCRDMGWEPVDTGGIHMSVHLEHMTLLWIHMARVQGQGADFVWAMLRR